MKSKAKIRLVPASEAKNNFGEMLKRVYENGETQIIERAGLPVVAVIPVSDFDQLYPDEAKNLPRVRASAKRERAWRHLKAVLDENPQAGAEVSDDQVMDDALKAVKEVRQLRGKAGKLAKPIEWDKMRGTARDEYVQGMVKRKRR